jgi:DNA adenine methylase
MTTSPVPYFGGKQTLAPRIVDLLPRHRHYVEPYCGSLAVLLAKAPSAMETVNDLDCDLVTFWRVLRDQPEDLARVCALTPHSRIEHQASYSHPAGCSDLETARRVWVKLTQGRGGVGVKTGWRHYVHPAGDTGMPAYLDGYVARMAVVAERLHRVSLECQPALDIITTYGQSRDVLLYVDPPYLGTSRADGSRSGTKRYTHEMLGEPDHRALAAALQQCTAAVVLSGYPSELYAELYAGWDRVEFAAGTGQSARGEWSTRTEVVWSNRPLNGQPALWDAS